jgi:hypothetical protein
MPSMPPAACSASTAPELRRQRGRIGDRQLAATLTTDVGRRETVLRHFSVDEGDGRGEGFDRRCRAAGDGA